MTQVLQNERDITVRPNYNNSDRSLNKPFKTKTDIKTFYNIF